MKGIRVVVIVAVSGFGAVACASAGGKGAPCGPVPVERRAGLAEVYAECGVDVKAEVQRPIPQVSYTPGAGERCSSAEVEVVVDTLGAVVRNSATVVRATHKSFADAVITSITSARFTPARKNGVRVAQVYRYGAGFTTMVAPAGSARATSAATRRGAPPGPRC